MDVFDLFAKLSLDTSEYEKGLDSAEKKGSNFGSGLLKATKLGGAALAAVGTAAIATGTAIVGATNDIASYGDNIDKMSQKIGISAEAYQEWDAILQHSGASVDSLQPAMKTLATQAQKGNVAFKKLGISEEQVANLSQEDLFSAVVAGLQNMEESTERTAIASELLGRGATELGALFNTTAEETENMRQKVHELGGVMSNEAVADAAKFQDTLQDMTTAFDGLKRGMISDFMPVITEVMEGLTAIFSGDESGVAKLSEGIGNFANKIIESLPDILDAGAEIVKTLLNVILENLPTLIDAGMEVIAELATGILDNLPEIITTAIEIIKTLAIGLIQALPNLIPAVVDIVLDIVDILIDNIDLLVDGAIAIVVGLAEGIIKALPRLLDRAPEIIEKLVQAIIRNVPKLLEAAVQIITKLVSGIIQNLPKLISAAGQIIVSLVSGIGQLFGKVLNIGKEIIDKVKEGLFSKIKDAANWGKDMLDNFIGGIKQKVGAVVDAVKGVGEKIKNFLGFSEPDEGPLSNFHTYAPDMMKLFTKGIADNEDMLYNQIKDTFDFGDMLTADVNVNKVSGGAFGYGSDTSVIVELLRQLVDKEVVTISADADGIFNIVRRKNNEYYEHTGDYAFIGG